MSHDAAASMLADLLRGVHRQEGGFADQFEEQRKRPLLDHLDEYERYLGSKGNTAKHARMTRNRVQAAIDGCGWVHITDISTLALLGWIKDERSRRAASESTSPASVGTDSDVTPEAAARTRVRSMGIATANY